MSNVEGKVVRKITPYALFDSPSAKLFQQIPPLRHDKVVPSVGMTEREGLKGQCQSGEKQRGEASSLRLPLRLRSGLRLIQGRLADDG